MTDHNASGDAPPTTASKTAANSVVRLCAVVSDGEEVRFYPYEVETQDYDDTGCLSESAQLQAQQEFNRWGDRLVALLDEDAIRKVANDAATAAGATLLFPADPTPKMDEVW